MYLKLWTSLLALALFTGCPRPTTDSPAQNDAAQANKKEDKMKQAAKSSPPPSNRPEPLPAPSDLLAPPADAEVAPSGLKSRILTAGKGTDKPKPTDVVRVHYSGWDKSGKMFDSSVVRGSPAVFPLNRVIKGWTEGVGLMVAGEKRRLWIPAAMAYGDTPRRPGAPSGDLVFDVELLEILPPPPEVKVPADVAAVPADATTTGSGLAYKSLSAGKSDQKPTATSVVEVHYSG